MAVSAEWEPQELDILFNMTMHGFGYASAWMERWKQVEVETEVCAEVSSSQRDPQ